MNQPVIVSSREEIAVDDQSTARDIAAQLEGATMGIVITYQPTEAGQVVAEMLSFGLSREQTQVYLYRAWQSAVQAGRR